MYPHHQPLGTVTIQKKEKNAHFYIWVGPHPTPSPSPFLDNVEIQADFPLLTFPLCNKTVSAPLITEPPPSSFTTSPHPKKREKKEGKKSDM